MGPGPWETLTRVVIPLCGSGLRAAALLVFIPCLGAYLTPDLLGGSKTVMRGQFDSESIHHRARLAFWTRLCRWC